VAAYFDLITDDARVFYGDSFHFGYFERGDETFEEAVNAHTDLVADMAHLDAASSTLDVGCGIGAPAMRIAHRHGCAVKGINISREQVRQGRRLVLEADLADRVTISEGDALRLAFDNDSFDAIVCIEVAGDICVTERKKQALVDELFRVLRPGGYVGFSDLVFTAAPTRREERTMKMLLYHDGAELISDWPALFRSAGFTIREQRDIMAETMPTWTHSLGIYERRAQEVDGRFGPRVAARTRRHLARIPDLMERYGAFVVMSVRKPA
jgi:O-methyltransferase StaMB